MPLSSFNVKRRNSNGEPVYQPYCRPCNKAYQQGHYLRNKPVYAAKARAYDKKIDAITLKNYLDYLSDHPCVDCGESDPVVLEFDHREKSEKSNSISALMWVKRTHWDVILKEIKKCDVRCANCHKRRTARQLGWRKAFLEN